MEGDDQVRHCRICDRKVFNLSNMTEADGKALMREQTGPLCIRYYQRADGTVMNRDCGFVERTGSRMKSVVGGFLTLLFGVTIFGFASPVHGAHKPPPGAMLKFYQKQVRLLSEEIQQEKDPEARKKLVELRAEASQNARSVARKILEAQR